MQQNKSLISVNWSCLEREAIASNRGSLQETEWGLCIISGDTGRCWIGTGERESGWAVSSLWGGGDSVSNRVTSPGKPSDTGGSVGGSGVAVTSSDASCLLASTGEANLGVISRNTFERQLSPNVNKNVVQVQFLWSPKALNMPFLPCTDMILGSTAIVGVCNGLRQVIKDSVQVIAHKSSFPFMTYLTCTHTPSRPPS